MKKILNTVALTIAIIMLVLSGSTELSIKAADSTDAKDIVVLYTNDVHNAYVRDEESLGYAAVAAYKKKLENEGYQVILTDGGDAIQGGVIGTLSNGQYLVDIMEQVGYSLAVPGNHEYDFGMGNFLNIAENSKYKYISCNFMDLKTGEPVFDEYEIVSFGNVDVAFVGITTPETFTKSTPKYFQDDKGNYIYGFCEGNQGQDLYDQVQKSIDAAKAEGADYIIALGHVGIDIGSEPWTSRSIIANTEGFDAFMDAHSHSTIPEEICKDKNGDSVTLCSTGTKLAAIGKLVIKQDGTVTTKLVTDVEEDDAETLSFVNDITAKFENLINQVVAKTDVNLVVNDLVSGDRLIRSQETNLGNLCADAYRIIMDGDIGFINGGGVRTDIKTGDITYGEIIEVNPFGNAICLIEATGQQILDALEHGSRMVGVSENGQFLHVSGITYEIDTTIPSSVVCDDKGEFVKVEGEHRVKNVKVAGQPLDLNKTYKLASHNYMLKNGGGGYSMFKGCKILLDEVMLDNEVLIKYISENLGGYISSDSIYANPYGEGRIKILTADDKKEDATEQTTENIETTTNKEVEQTTENKETTISKEVEQTTETKEKENKTDTEEESSTEAVKKTMETVKTGDSNNIMMYILLACAASMVIVGVSRSRGSQE